MARKRQDTGVFQLANGDWGYRFRVNIDGKNVDRRRVRDDNGKPFKNKTSATRARKQALEDVYSNAGVLDLPVGVLPPVNNEVVEGKTVADVFAEFCEKGRSDRAYQTMRKQDSLWKNHLSKKFGGRRLDSITTVEVQDYLASLYIDKQSGKDADRPKLKEMLAFIRKGDVIIAESISRIARNTKDLLTIVETINGKGAEFVSLKESLDTRTPTGKFMLTVFGAMAELEREYILQRQAEGIEIAKAEGKFKGKPKMEIDEDAFKRECKRWRDGEQTATATMKKLNIKPNTFYRRVKEMGL